MKESNEGLKKTTLNKGTNFLVSIYYQENHSYQGTIQWIDTGKKVNFRSEMELLNLIHEATQRNRNDQQQLRTWEDSKGTQIG